MKRIHIILCFTIIVLWSTSMSAEPKIGQQAPDFVSTALDGKIHRLKHYKGKVVVLEWVNYDCPYVQRLYKNGEILKMQKKVVQNGGVWLSIISESPRKLGFFWRKRLARSLKKYGIKDSILLVDKKGVVGRSYRIPRSPHFLVIDPKGKVRYIGSFDNQAHLQEKPVGDPRQYIDEALFAIDNNRSVAKEKTVTYGCDIRYY